jgi:hypothetical protein
MRCQRPSNRAIKAFLLELLISSRGLPLKSSQEAHQQQERHRVLQELLQVPDLHHQAPNHKVVELLPLLPKLPLVELRRMAPELFVRQSQRSTQRTKELLQPMIKLKLYLTIRRKHK